MTRHTPSVNAPRTTAANDACFEDGRHEMMVTWCGQHFRAKHQCVNIRMTARIAELEHEVSVYLKRIDEATARMSNLHSDGVESERARIVALLRYGRTDGGETITSSKHAAEVIERGDRGPATAAPSPRR